MAIIGAVISAGASIIGGLASRNSQKKAEDRAAQAQYEQDLQNYNYNWDETLRNFNFIKEGNQITRQNNENLFGYQDELSLSNWRDQLKIADREDRMNLSAYNKSLQQYDSQLSFNNVALVQAQQAERTKLQEAVTEMAFQSQNNTISGLEEAGAVQARGVSGRSAGKELHAVLASAARNQAIIAESLVSANKNFGQTMTKLGNEKYGADLQAWANVMVKPEKAALPSAPLKTVRPVVQDPRDPVAPPAPVKGQTSAGSVWPTIMNGVATLAGGFQVNPGSAGKGMSIGIKKG
jgi:hypothetical protein